MSKMAIYPWHTIRRLVLFKIQLVFFMTSLLPMMIPAIWYHKTLPCVVTTNKTQGYVTVDCSEQHLRELPDDIPLEVTNLSLTINDIHNIDPSNFEKFKKLQEIDFRCNCLPPKLGPQYHVCNTKLKIETHGFAKLHKLKSLYLDGNQLSAIPRGLPPNLLLLSLEVNNIFSIHGDDFIELRKLENLFLGKNCYYRNACNTSFFINETAFHNLTALRLLSLKANNISTVPKNLPSTLTELYLYNNDIRNISEHDLSGLHNLETLDLSGNCPRCHNAPYNCTECPNKASIVIHPNAFDSLEQLRILRLHSTSLRAVKSQWFYHTKKLEVLDLSQNYLANEIEKADFLNYLPNLITLDLSFNFELGEYRSHLSLSKTFSNLTNLQTLRLRGFVFKELDGSTINNLISLKNLNVLDFGTNFIRNVNLTLFKKLPALKVINLAFNKISLVSNDGNGGFYSSLEPSPDRYYRFLLQDMPYFMYDEYSRSCKSKNKEVSYSFPFTTEASCREKGKTLDLSRNNIFFITASDFQQLTDLQCLNLSSNAMSQTLNGTEFKYLPHLKYLDFSDNRVDLLYPNAFEELRELEVLNLSDNSHYFKAEGITHVLGFTKKLTNLTTLTMNGNEISTSTEKGMESNSLTTLEFRRNHLDVLWKEDYYSFFKNLTKLEHLDISENSLTTLPSGVFDGLPSELTELRLASNKMKKFSWKKLQVLEKLEVLDLSNNQLTTVPLKLSKCSKTIKKLMLQNNNIKKLTDNFLQNAVTLKYLDLSFNKIKTLKNSSFPKDVINNLTTLLLHGNPFRCNCDLVWFVWWVNQTNVTIPFLATDVTCASPGTWRGRSVVYLNLETCELDFSQILYLASVSAIMFLMIITTISQLYFWDMWYLYHFFAASLKGYKRLFSSDIVYDAFIAYDKRDAAVSEWVLKELVEKLEDQREKQFNLCLEERDWLPGEPVLNNLSESIQVSRKTVFVLTNKYIASGNFRMAFYLAHQRLMDEKVDVIILIFLEKVLQMSKCLRLRKILCSQSVLEWPTNPRSQCYFWHCLRNSLTANHDTSYSKLFKEMV